MFEGVGKNPWNEINIETDLEIQCQTEPTCWIQDRRTGKELEVMLDPMWIWESSYDQNDEADGGFQEMQQNSECFAWIRRLEQWAVKKATERDVWIKERHRLMIHLEEDMM